MAKRKLLSIKATKQFEKEIERRWAVNQAIKEQVGNIIIQPSEVPYKKKIYGDIFQLPYTHTKRLLLKGEKQGDRDDKDIVNHLRCKLFIAC